MQHVFLFPGQSSRHPAMFDWIAAGHPSLWQETLQLASAVLTEPTPPLLAAAVSGTGVNVTDPFPDNRSLQLCVFLANYLRMRVLQDRGVDAELSVGLSLGEYNHLVHIGALSLEEGLRLVDARGRAYDAGPVGGMLAVFPTEESELVAVVAEAARRHPVAISNYNSPSQFVVAGPRAGVDEVAALVEQDTFAQCRWIEDRLPMHCAYFASVAEDFAPALARARFQVPRAPYLPNVEAQWLRTPTASEIRDALRRHVFEAVRFRESVDLLMAAAPDATLVEVGPQKVLSNLLNKRWCKLPTRATDTAADVERLLQAGA